MKKYTLLLLFSIMFFQCGIVKNNKNKKEIVKLKLENAKLEQEILNEQLKTTVYQRQKVDSVVLEYENVIKNDTIHPLYTYLKILKNIQFKLHNIQDSLELLEIEKLEGDAINKFKRYTKEREQYLNTMELVMYHVGFGFYESKNDSVFFDEGSWKIKLSGQKYIKNYH